MKEFGTLKRLDPRQAWPKEAVEFSPWLAEHLSELGKALEMEIELQEREAQVGSFSLDLRARDVGRNKTVIIENQLELTDHDHLGKLITYAAGLDAAVAIWIATEIREEHRQAIDWLNRHTESEVEFFAVLVEVLQIDDSKLAYNFRPIAFPNSWSKGKVPKDGSNTERGERYKAYFQQLIDELRERCRFTNARIAQPQNWYSFASGTSGVTYGANFAQHGRVRTELYIGSDDASLNKNLFDRLFQQKELIEAEFGERLEWERLDSRLASRVALYREGTIDSDSSLLEELRRWSTEHLLKFKQVLGPTLRDLMASKRQ